MSLEPRPTLPARPIVPGDRATPTRRPSLLKGVLALSLLVLTTSCIEGLGPDPPSGTRQPLNPTVTPGPPVPPPDPAAVTWSPVDGGLRLGVAADGTLVRLGLQNVGTRPLPVMSYTAATLLELNWTTLLLTDSQGTTRKLLLGYDRDPPEGVVATLAPGADLWQQVDLTVWTRLALNAVQSLNAGSYQLTAVYEVSPRGNRWSGRLTSGPVRLTVSAP